MPRLTDAIRRLYDVPVYRGSSPQVVGRNPGYKPAGARVGWWAHDPAEANEFLTLTHYPNDKPAFQYQEGSTVIPGQLNTRDFAVVDVKGQRYNNIPTSYIKDTRLRSALEQEGWSTNADVVSTDILAKLSLKYDIPGITFLNTTDPLGVPSTQYFVADPRRTRIPFPRSNRTGQNLNG